MKLRVLRGGSWNNSSQHALTACRSFDITTAIVVNARFRRALAASLSRECQPANRRIAQRLLGHTKGG